MRVFLPFMKSAARSFPASSRLPFFSLWEYSSVTIRSGFGPNSGKTSSEAGPLLTCMVIRFDWLTPAVRKGRCDGLFGKIDEVGTG